MISIHNANKIEAKLKRFVILYTFNNIKLMDRSNIDYKEEKPSSYGVGGKILKRNQSYNSKRKSFVPNNFKNFKENDKYEKKRKGE